jgi:hypothetical protein
MTAALALEYIPRRMEELGYGKNYYIRFRHLVLQPDERLDIEAYNQFYIIIDQPTNVNIASDFGLYGLELEITNELQYEHQGFISIHNNLVEEINHIQFIQIIPKHTPLKSKQQHG